MSGVRRSTARPLARGREALPIMWVFLSQQVRREVDPKPNNNLCPLRRKDPTRPEGSSAGNMAARTHGDGEPTDAQAKGA